MRPPAPMTAMKPLMMACFLLASSGFASAMTSGSIEPEPSLRAEQLLPPGLAITGPNWSVDSPVPIEGFLGQFVLRTQWGAIHVQGSELLLERIAEIPAMQKIDTITRSAVFTDAIVDSARSTTRAVTQVVTQPVETAKGVPAGLGRLLGKTAAGVRRVAVDIGDAVQRGPESIPDEDSKSASDTLMGFADELAGVNHARRTLASALGVDPYTSNPMLREKLGQLARASVAGGFSTDLLLGQLGSTTNEILSTTQQINSAVWEKAPADIARELEARLVQGGIEPRAAREFLRNSSFTPTLQLQFVSALEGLGRPAGAADLIGLATGIRGEVHARFLLQQLLMLQGVHAQAPVSELIVHDASTSALSAGNTRVFVMPVDHLSWTEVTNLVADQYEGLHSRIIVSGSVSDLAEQRLRDAGWEVIVNAGIVSISEHQL